jgi:hypothetical protein
MLRAHSQFDYSKTKVMRILQVVFSVLMLDENMALLVPDENTVILN